MAPDPGRTALYRLYEERADQLVYIGITSNPERRFAQHAADKYWWGCVARKTIEWYETRAAALAAEEAAIKRYEPWFNSEHCRFPPEFTVTVRLSRYQLPGIDLLREMHGLSREELLGGLLVRELAARGLDGDGPCFHYAPAWPEGAIISPSHYGDGEACRCGALVSDPPDIWEKRGRARAGAGGFMSGGWCVPCQRTVQPGGG